MAFAAMAPPANAKSAADEIADNLYCFLSVYVRTARRSDRR
jgi:hypothetical protein